MIEAGLVTVGGAPARAPGRLVAPAESVALARVRARFVSRGGEKLAAALDCFGLDVSGRRCLDAGASTGGFTDCLLQRGAAHVVAVDVGRGQLAWSLRRDPRVTVLERTNVRTLESIGEPADLVTADLSFISLRLVAPALVRLARADADFVLLVKPQFEAGPERVGKGGVVRDPRVHREVLAEVVAGLTGAGLVTVGVAPSVLRGADGNVELVVHCRRTGEPVSSEALDAVVAEAHGEPS